MLELTVAQACERIPAGALLNTQNPASSLTDAIRVGESLESGEIASFGHTMRKAPGEAVYSQETRLVVLPLARWVGCILRAYINPQYTAREFGILCDEEVLRLGTRYDWIGTSLGQLCRWVPFLGDWLASKVDIPWTNFCSEGRCEIEKKIYPRFNRGAACQISPQDIDDFCLRDGWEILTFRLVA